MKKKEKRIRAPLEKMAGLREASRQKENEGRWRKESLKIVLGWSEDSVPVRPEINSALSRPPEK